ncbi:MAG: HAMP domain-containing histidine kinase [Treponema sp.]|jgi:two-component system sensor histidine kinase HydH|nr:HAMP domain-containing histidine kinase [Treponema sp.]
MKKAAISLTKISAQSLSLIVSLFLWLLFSVLVVFIIRGMWDRARLIRDNENEQIFNTLFTSLRNHEDFGSVIESNPALMERIFGFAVYGNDLVPVYSWGKVPPVFDEGILGNNLLQGGTGRYTIPDKKGKSVKFVLRTETLQMPNLSSGGGRRNQRMMVFDSESEQLAERMMNGPGSERGGRRGERMQMRIIERQGFPFFNTLARGRYYYFDINHPAYWRSVSFGAVLLPLCCLAILGLVFYIRHLYMRNREYRKKIEAQKNLVVLGTASSTLAHEIKTPLSSIRLQTGILEKLYAHGKEELNIINDEVDRLSSLSLRINDYIREGNGNPERINLCDLINESGARLCGRGIITGDSVNEAWVYADPERLRSVFENLIRNALESGGADEDVCVSVFKPGGNISAHVLDRGRGISGEDLGKVFEPFFTRKSNGTGIGLSICRRFTEAAGGSINIKNRESGGGIEVIVLLPEYST